MSEEIAEEKKLTQNPSNFLKWRRNLLIDIKAVYGDYADQLKEKMLKELELPPAEGVNQKDKIELESYLEDMKHVKREKAARTVILPKLMGFILKHISTGAMRELLSKPEDKFAEMSGKANDIIGVWKLIEKYHCGNVTGNSIYDRFLAIMDFVLQQKRGQTLEGYIIECTEKIDMLTLLDVCPGEHELSFRFCKGLDPGIYGSSVARWIADRTIPETFTGATVLASNTYASMASSGAIPKSTAQFDDSPHLALVASGAEKCLWCDKAGHTAQTCRGLIRHKAEWKDEYKRVQTVALCTACGVACLGDDDYFF